MKVLALLFLLISTPQAQVLRENGSSLVGVSGTLGVANGGTGQTSLTANAILVGNGTSGITQSTVARTINGEVYFGSAPSISTMTQGGDLS